MFSLFSSFIPSHPRTVTPITTKWLLTIVKTTNKFSSNITLVQVALTLGLSDKVKQGCARFAEILLSARYCEVCAR